jgi:hypothetical protein
MTLQLKMALAGYRLNNRLSPPSDIMLAHQLLNHLS